MPGTASTLAAHDSLLLIVDMQERLLPAIRDADALCGRVARLAQAAPVLVHEMLNMLERWPLAQWGAGSAQTIHTMAETMKLAYADRAEYLGDVTL